jgi:FkbM family methyltransferase
MNLLTYLVKAVLQFLFLIIKRSKDSVIYIFEVILKNELKIYLDKKYYRGYVHIEKAISIAGFYKINEKCIIDVGGSTGFTALKFSEAFPMMNVFVFEPLKESFQKLIGNIGGHPNIIAINKAVGNFSGISKIKVLNQISSSSLLEINNEYSSETAVSEFHKIGVEEILIDTLDNLIPKDDGVLILKIDVQGYEMEVLKGAEKTLSKTQIILIEVSNHEGYINSSKYYEIDAYLRSKEFILFDIFPSIHEYDKLLEWDTIYKKAGTK